MDNENMLTPNIKSKSIAILLNIQ